MVNFQNIKFYTMRHIFKYWIMRVFQLARLITIVGIFRTVFLAILLVYAFFFIDEKITQVPINYLLIFIVSYVIFIIHRRRNDYLLILKTFKLHYFLFFLDYVICSLPLALIMIKNCQSILLGILWGSCLLNSFLNTRPINRQHQNMISKLFTFIPTQLFEWKSGFRQNILYLILIYVLCFLGIINLYIGLIFFIILFLIIISFYFENESREIIEAEQLSSSKFLKTKIRRNLKFYLLFVFPIFSISLIFNPSSYIEILLFYLSTANVFIFNILFKYTYFIPHESGIINMLQLSIAIIALFPPFSIVILFINYFLYIKATKNLNNYLYDFN